MLRLVITGRCATFGPPSKDLQQHKALLESCSIASSGILRPRLPAAVACLEQAKDHQPNSFCVHSAVLDCSTHTAAALAAPDGAEDDAEGALLCPFLPIPL